MLHRENGCPRVAGLAATLNLGEFTCLPNIARPRRTTRPTRSKKMREARGGEVSQLKARDIGQKRDEKRRDATRRDETRRVGSTIAIERWIGSLMRERAMANGQHLATCKVDAGESSETDLHREISEDHSCQLTISSEYPSEPVVPLPRRPTAYPVRRPSTLGSRVAKTLRLRYRCRSTFIHLSRDSCK